MVERDLAKVDVAGSTPVSRSSFSLAGSHPCSPGRARAAPDASSGARRYSFRRHNLREHDFHRAATTPTQPGKGAMGKSGMAVPAKR